MDNGNILASNAGSVARLLAGVLGGILTSVGIAADDGALETIIGGILVAVAGIWAIVKNAKAAKVTQDAAKKAGALVLLLAFGWMLAGCAVIRGSAGDSNYMGFAFGEKASSTLAGLNITETQTEAGNVVLERGVGVDQSGVTGEADVGKILGNLLLLGLQSQGIPAGAGQTLNAQRSTLNAQRSTLNAQVENGEGETLNAQVESETEYSTEGFSASPGADGSGVYGKTSCPRCRAFKTAHPDVPLIDLADAENKAAMWAALRRLGYEGTSVSLPVAVTGTGFTQAAK